MAYAAWSVVAGEQPTAAKWNILGTNDAGFNDGTAIGTGAITSAKISGLDQSLITTNSNPYKFRATRNAAANTGAAAFALVAMDTEQFDTNNNHSGGTYTIPVTGFYMFAWGSHATTTGTQVVLSSLFKNGTEYTRGSRPIGTSVVLGSTGSDLIPATAADSLTNQAYSDTARPLDVGNTTNNYFSGALFCRT